MQCYFIHEADHTLLRACYRLPDSNVASARFVDGSITEGDYKHFKSPAMLFSSAQS